MSIKKGKKTSVEGPIKSFIMGTGVVALLSGAATVYNGVTGQGLLIIVSSVVILWLGSKIPNKNRVEW